jgi:hypothetical protein
MRGEGPGSLRLRALYLLLPPVLPMATTSAGVEPSGRRDTRKGCSRARVPPHHHELVWSLVSSRPTQQHQAAATLRDPRRSSGTQDCG